MIYIRKSQTNSIVLTLSESCKAISPYFLFEFYNEGQLGDAPVLFATDDISLYTGRYNQFQLIDDIAGSGTGGINTPLSLKAGQWAYSVYETASLTLTKPSTSPLEQGRMIVTGDNTTPSIYD